MYNSECLHKLVNRLDSKGLSLLFRHHCSRICMNQQDGLHGTGFVPRMACRLAIMLVKLSTLLSWSLSSSSSTSLPSPSDVFICSSSRFISVSSISNSAGDSPSRSSSMSSNSSKSNVVSVSQSVVSSASLSRLTPTNSTKILETKSHLARYIHRRTCCVPLRPSQYIQNPAGCRLLPTPLSSFPNVVLYFGALPQQGKCRPTNHRRRCLWRP
jgi:hypothetical protein